MTQKTAPDIFAPLIEEFARSGLRELHVRKGDFELYLSSDPSLRASLAAGQLNSSRAPSAQTATAPAISARTPGAKAAAPIMAQPADLPADAVIISAPNLGTFYRAPKPGAPNYIEIGSKVGIGDELCLIEVMKLFTALRSDAAGTVHTILVEDGAMVKAGQPLFALVVN